MHPFESKSVFVTGGTGFIGSHLVRRLVKEGFQTHLLIRPESSLWRIEDLQDKIVSWHGDISNLPSLKRGIQGAQPEIVFHLAGDTQGRNIQGHRLIQSSSINLLGALNLFEVILETRKTGLPFKRIVTTGGLEEYGNGPIPYQENQRENPVSPYSASQVAATHYAQMTHRTMGLPVVILRPALVYGPAQTSEFFIPSLIKQCLAGESFEMTSGEQTRDLIYVDDVIEAFVKTMTARDLDGEILNISTGQEHTMADVAKLILHLTGKSISIRPRSFGSWHKTKRPKGSYSGHLKLTSTRGSRRRSHGFKTDKKNSYCLSLRGRRYGPFSPTPEPDSGKISGGADRPARRTKWNWPVFGKGMRSSANLSL